MEHLLTTEAIISLVTLTIMEIILGVDNVVFISIVSGKLPEDQQPRARNIGLTLALIPRILLLLAISWIIHLHDAIISFTLAGTYYQISEKGLILILGGIFLIYSSTKEIHHKMTGKDDEEGGESKAVSFSKVIFSIVLLNIVFSFDSVLTAVGLAKHVEVMIIAVVISSLIMMGFAGGISRFVNKNPTVKVLALSFLLMIGMLLVAEAVEFKHLTEAEMAPNVDLSKLKLEEVHVPKGYIYFAMAFSLFVELLNLRISKTNAKTAK
jgi:predicted tellurium resistance membrane protein TerC